MTNEELRSRYGAHVLQRVRRELTSSEFNAVAIDALSAWLEARAESAHERYVRLLNDPLSASETGIPDTGAACTRWREAEDLAYLVAVAEDVGTRVSAR
jgi:hypothetical protein